MIEVRKSADRGHFNFGWLNTYHSFSFGDYYDPAHMGFGSLRVLNEDWIQPAKGFPTHSHRDMEIITYVLQGALEHKDSMGNSSVIRPGEIQRMTAGTGVTHSEFNPSDKETTHLLQIWFLPEKKGLSPDYEQKLLPGNVKKGRLRLVISPDGQEGSVRIHQDVRGYVVQMAKGGLIDFAISDHRRGWVQIVQGNIKINGTPLVAGDGAAVAREKNLKFEAGEDAEIFLFDLS